MTMAASLEARVPLLNNRIVDFLSGVPSRVKMPFGRTKELLRKAMEPFLPVSILNKPKKGFGPPSSQWVRGDFADVFKRVFARDRIEAQHLFSWQEIDRLLHEHRERIADHGRNLWALLSFQGWYDRFILKQSRLDEYCLGSE
ncbi:hypothetical protein AUK22_08955 [bacterium CG2_30_54_10]|nr:MAG: hypothetical protein AUK22_08955 [bacterium CG2_30_54_10]